MHVHRFRLTYCASESILIFVMETQTDESKDVINVGIEAERHLRLKAAAKSMGMPIKTYVELQLTIAEEAPKTVANRGLEKFRSRRSQQTA